MTSPITICATCGVETADNHPETCPICADERQYLPAGGVQKWTTLAELTADRQIEFFEIEPGLWGITAEPAVGIGQRSILVQTPAGNLLWDPIGFINEDAIARVRELGGIRWIAASHPHMYGVQSAWSAAFDDAPILISEADASWVQRPNDAIQHWQGMLNLTENLTLHQVGGHFAGSAVVYWLGADGTGVLLTGDSIFPVPAKGWVAFCRSYPNRIPLSGRAVQRIADTVLPLSFYRLYGNFHTIPITEGAHEAVRRSAERHIAWVNGEHDDET